ncbi:MAG: hypothetical protein E5V59_09020 [Mesorhizobium sp.]|nr:MAG: hypothetical protein E5V59_09020 [Mesorhizobium sp.]
MSGEQFPSLIRRCMAVQLFKTELDSLIAQLPQIEGFEEGEPKQRNLSGRNFRGTSNEVAGWE